MCQFGENPRKPKTWGLGWPPTLSLVLGQALLWAWLWFGTVSGPCYWLGMALDLALCLALGWAWLWACLWAGPDFGPGSGRGPSQGRAWGVVDPGFVLWLWSGPDSHFMLTRSKVPEEYKHAKPCGEMTRV